ncbi:hypothetical protein HPB48_017420 [Haemaphysalis longicornis]|uniref:AMP-dependent synthetase/ligase domain-containing protein n=1 Tax=Haemaphysalis longicornis TaxID=44386 RepID=A0A9J6H3Z4_HAELO|nr:hypothetical protein HPB48_017420 [Haemaphysalis longicornis]
MRQVDDHLCLTRRQFLDRIRRYAVGFQARGIGPGDTVCAYLSNSVENFVAMYGVAFSGATVMLAKTSLTERTHAQQCSLTTGLKGEQ